ncbi:MAG: VOC family protein [Methylococcales bacterium]|nr:VOC family protein [Methylococcales bacterium]
MKVLAINHINIEVTEAQLPEMIRFYQAVLGFNEGYRMPSRRGGAWLYSPDNAVAMVHLSVIPEAPPTGQKTHFNHVAYTCQDVPAALARLKQHGIHFDQQYMATPGMTQLFFYDPVGIRIELNFPGEALPDA